MDDIEAVKKFIKEKYNKSEMVKTYTYTIKEFKDGMLKSHIEHDGNGKCSAAYIFFDEHKNIQYVGRAIREVWKRIRDHIEGKKNDNPNQKELTKKIKDNGNWSIVVCLFPVVLYGDCENEIKHEFEPRFNKG